MKKIMMLMVLVMVGLMATGCKPVDTKIECPSNWNCVTPTGYDADLNIECTDGVNSLLLCYDDNEFTDTVGGFWIGYKVGDECFEAERPTAPFGHQSAENQALLACGYTEKPTTTSTTTSIKCMSGWVCNLPDLVGGYANGFDICWSDTEIRIDNFDNQFEAPEDGSLKGFRFINKDGEYECVECDGTVYWIGNKYYGIDCKDALKYMAFNRATSTSTTSIIE